DPTTGRLDTLEVEGHRDHFESLRDELLAQVLPHGQVVPAASPGGPGQEQDLASALRSKLERAALPVGQHEIRRFGRLQSPAKPPPAKATPAPGTTARLARRAAAACSAAGKVAQRPATPRQARAWARRRRLCRRPPA